MPGNSFGQILRISSFGESHGPAVGVIIEGLPPRMPVDLAAVQAQLERRKPGQLAFSSPRSERDQVAVLSGLFEGRCTGAPLCLVIYNHDAKPQDYSQLKDIYRPGHADYSYQVKYGIRDWRGSARASGRETAARVAAGAVAQQLLCRLGTSITAYTSEVAGISSRAYIPEEIEKNPLRAADPETARAMQQRLEEIQASGDSAGGIITCRINACPAGLGEPVFDKLEADLAKAMLSLGAVRGFEIGSGFAAARMLGSEHNDPILPISDLSPSDEKVSQGSRTRAGLSFGQNHGGGIAGGISTGAEIIFRIAVKPPSSISKPQKSSNSRGEVCDLQIEGRHDTCICARIVPVVEAMSALVIADHYLRQVQAAQGSKLFDAENIQESL